MPPDASGGARAASIEKLLRRDRLIVLFCLAAAAGLAWWYTLRQAGFGRPHAGTMGAMMDVGQGTAALDAAYLIPAFAMWSLMMVAMMLPSAVPMILLYARIARQSGAPALPNTTIFALVYVLVWAGFGAAAALLQGALVASGLISAMSLSLANRPAAGAMLIVAGLYQLSPLKNACLASCRSPIDLLMSHWRPTFAGAVRLGFVHGLYCVGCCWALMLLLFVGGVMNMLWVVALAALVLLEKTAAPWLKIATGAGLVGAGAVLLIL